MSARGAIDFCQALGARIDAEWRKTDCDTKRFAAIATEMFGARPPAAEVTKDDLVEWALTSEKLPAQADLDARFGEPPLTVYAGQKFYIAALFWLDGTTTIHQHAFSGAFHVLHGSSLHCRYTFTDERDLGGGLKIGELRRVSAELLERGATHAIPSGDALIHSLFHLDRPSVTLIARTVAEPETGPQFDYLRPSVALSPRAGTPEARRGLQLLRMMRRLDDPRWESATRARIESSDPTGALLLLRDLQTSLDPSALDPFVRLAEARHPALASTLRSLLTHRVRESTLIEKRRRVHDPEHRFLLALLLNVDTRREVLDLVAARFPGADPVTKIVTWLTALGDGRAGGDGPRLGVELGEAELTIVKALLRGADLDGVRAALREDFDDDDVTASDEAIARLVHALKHSPMLTGLFG